MVAVEGTGVGGSTGGATETCRGCEVVWPLGAIAVRTTSCVVRTVTLAVPLGGKLPGSPVIVTPAAPVVLQVAVAVSGAQPEVGVIVKLSMVGAVEKAARDTASGTAVPSLVRLSFLTA
jgi:hypothetical protein